ncbi:MAG: circadian clock protein KaiB [Candidatus Thermoplasmatota archaeon]|nr:circadian clock protein KaiB [Candidatus Thermoplasmatota archaeon]
MDETMNEEAVDGDPIILRLYVTGQTPSSREAIEAIEELCQTQFQGTYDLEVIDVREDPERAEEDKIMATPTLVKELPPPLRKLIGDLSDHERVLVGLELDHLHRSPPNGSVE